MNATEVGVPSYQQGPNWPDFGNAVRIDAAAEAIAVIQSNGMMQQPAGCIECWIWTDGWTIANGVASVGTHAVWEGRRLPGFNNAVMLLFNVAGFYFTIMSGGVGGGFGLVAQNPPGMNSANQEWHHLGCPWSITGIDGGPNTQRVYWDGVELAASSNALAMPLFLPTQIMQIGNILAANTWQGRIDNFKVWSYAKIDFADRFEEGFTPEVQTDPHPAILFDRRQARIEIFGTDIVCRTNAIPKLTERRTLGSDLLIPNDAKIVVENFDNAFSLNNPRSVFAGTNFRGEPVRVWDRYGVKIWDGLLEDPIVDHAKKTTTIVSRSHLYKWRKEPVVYTSAGAETPAAALRNIMAAIGFTDYSDPFLQQSDDRQTAAGLTILVTLLEEDSETFGNVVNRLADFGCADVYEHLGKLRYVHYFQDPPTPITNIAECQLLGQPDVVVNTMDLINDYAIQWVGPNTGIDADNGNIGAISRARNGVFQNQKVGLLDAKYTLQTATGAIYLGESWIHRTHVNLATRPEPRTRVKIALEVEHRAWVDLTADFALTYARENWDEKTFRVVGFVRDDQRRTIEVESVEWPA